MGKRRGGKRSGLYDPWAKKIRKNGKTPTNDCIKAKVGCKLDTILTGENRGGQERIDELVSSSPVVNLNQEPAETLSAAACDVSTTKEKDPVNGRLEFVMEEVTSRCHRRMTRSNKHTANGSDGKFEEYVRGIRAATRDTREKAFAGTYAEPDLNETLTKTDHNVERTKKKKASDVETEWEVEKILDHIKSDDGYHYLLKWVGYEDPSWNAEIDMTGCAKLIRMYWTENRERGKKELSRGENMDEEEAAGSSSKKSADVGIDVWANDETPTLDEPEAFPTKINLEETEKTGPDCYGRSTVTQENETGDSRDGDVSRFAVGRDDVVEVDPEKARAPDLFSGSSVNTEEVPNADTSSHGADSMPKSLACLHGEITCLRSETAGGFTVSFMGENISRFVTVEESQGILLDSFLKFYERRLEPPDDDTS